MMEYLYRADIENIAKAFPPGRCMPDLLKDFAQWLSTREEGGVGFFALVAGFAESAPVYDGASLWQDFALFLRLGNGSEGGFWYGAPGADPDNPPVVLLDSEGQYAFLAPDLESFLAKIAINPYSLKGPWAEFHPSDEGDETGDLAKWLTEQLGIADLKALANRTCNQDGIQEFFLKRLYERAAFWAEHPICLEIAELLSPYRPVGQPSWSTSRFNFIILGDLYYATFPTHVAKPKLDEDRLHDLVLRLRKTQLCFAPELGNCMEIRLDLDGAGKICPVFEYLYRPQLHGVPVPVSAFMQDLKTAPRLYNRIPDWVRAEADSEELRKLAL